MKHTAFIFILFGLLSISSCAKKYNCDCVLTTTDANGTETSTTTTFVIKDTRVKAINACKAMDDTEEDYICDIAE